MSLDSKLDPLFEKLIADQWLPGVAGAIYDASGKALYHKAFGVNNLADPSSKSFTTSTPLALFSTTKLFACVAALQLIEQGKLALDDLAEKYVPEIAEIPVADGHDSSGKAQYRPQSTKITILHLLTHTAGFTYDFMHPSTLAWRAGVQQKEPLQYFAGAKWAFETPRIHEAGADFNYGINIDWLGFVIEAITGQKLSQYVDAHIVKPLGLKHTTADPPEDGELLAVHLRNAADGKLSPLPAPPPDAPKPARYGGGHYLTGTLDDYTQFLLAIVNYGTHPTSGVKILERATVEKYLFHDFIPDICPNTKNVGLVTSSVPQFTLTGQFLPSLPLGWSAGFLINNADVPGGRKRGSGFWAGLGNLYYWLDPVAGRVGMVVTNVLPFMDPRVLEVFDALEKTAYGGEPETDPAKRGFSVP
ncbi:hypothetical protein DV737_g2028, partial [Chaetothyriales sp. CBS 132003]